MTDDQLADEQSPDPAPLDPVALAILDSIGALGAGQSLDPQDIAKSYAATKRRPSDPPELWRRYLPAVRQQALFLARRGRIAILRKGKPVSLEDGAPVKGVIRLAAVGGR